MGGFKGSRWVSLPHLESTEGSRKRGKRGAWSLLRYWATVQLGGDLGELGTEEVWKK